jgi:hypothetical protein
LNQRLYDALSRRKVVKQPKKRLSPLRIKTLYFPQAKLIKLTAASRLMARSPISTIQTGA